MLKQYQNYSAFTVIKQPGPALGLARILNFKGRDEKRGALLLAAAIEIPDKDNEKIIKIIAEELAKQFFHSPTANIEFAFENALSRVNLAAKEILLSKPKSWLNKIHLVCLAARDQEVHLAAVGEMRVFFVHQDRLADVLAPSLPAAASYRRGYPGEGRTAATPNPLKLFSNIVSGRLLPRAALVLINEPVLDYLSRERIRKESQELTPALAVQKLHGLLAAAPTNKQFTIAVIKRLPVESRAGSAAPAIEPPLAKSEIVAQYLKPESALAWPKDRPGFTAVILKYLKSALESGVRWGGHYGQKFLTIALLTASKLLEKIERRLTALRPQLRQLPKLTKTLFLDSKARGYYLGQAKNYWQGRKERLLNRWQILAPKQKKVLLALVALILLLAGSIVISSEKRGRTRAAAAYQVLVKEINEKSDQAEAALIYQDEERAQTILAAAKETLKTLPQTNEKERGQYGYLETRLNMLLARLEKKENWGELTPFATLESAPASSETTGLLAVGQEIFYYSGQEKKLIKVNAESGLAVDLLFPEALPAFRRALALDSQTVALLDVDRAAVVNIAERTVQSRELNTQNNAGEPFTSYAKNLYTFSRPNNQIIRYQETGGAWQAPASWLKEDYDLRAMQDIAVDGSLYLLAGSGEIHVLANNAPSKVWQLPLLEPVGDAARLYTHQFLKNLYVLDPVAGRLLQISKKGELAHQYVSPQLKGASGLALDSREKEIYFLAGDKIFRVSL